jgi:hypothetical protein
MEVDPAHNTPVSIKVIRVLSEQLVSMNASGQKNGFAEDENCSEATAATPAAPAYPQQVEDFDHTPEGSDISRLPGGYHMAREMFKRPGMLKMFEIVDNNLCIMLRTSCPTTSIRVRIEGAEAIVPGMRKLANYEQCTQYTSAGSDGWALYNKLMHNEKGHEWAIIFRDGTVVLCKLLRPDIEGSDVEQAPWTATNIQTKYNVLCEQLGVKPLRLVSSVDMPGASSHTNFPSALEPAFGQWGWSKGAVTQFVPAMGSDKDWVLAIYTRDSGLHTGVGGKSSLSSGAAYAIQYEASLVAKKDGAKGVAELMEARRAAQAQHDREESVRVPNGNILLNQRAKAAAKAVGAAWGNVDMLSMTDSVLIHISKGMYEYVSSSL